MTFTILDKMTARPGLLRIPMAVFLDLVIAAILACGSIYFGLVSTNKALGLTQLLYILVAHSPDGSQVEFSPYFWVMHTTFIPTLLYLLFLLGCWIGKSLLLPVRW